MTLAQFAFRVGAGGVEITQADRFQTVGRVVVSQHLLDHQFGAAVRVNRLLRMALVDRCVLRVAESCRRRREDELPHAMRAHSIEQIERIGEVVLVVLGRLLH